MARISFTGNVSNPKYQEVNGQPLLSFDVGENHSYFDDDKQEWIETGTSWHKCSVWGSKAQAWKDFVRKGCGVLVEGVRFTRTSTKLDDNGKPFNNEGVRVISLGFTPNRIKSIEFKEATGKPIEQNAAASQQQNENSDSGEAPFFDESEPPFIGDGSEPQG